MFCNQCGNELGPGVSFCPKCGHPVSAVPRAEANDSKAQRLTVTFFREKQWFAINPGVTIVVDDGDVYQIDNGQTLNVPMAPGTHNIVFKCGIRNKVIDLTVQQDLKLRLKWNRITGSLIVE